jgi:peptide/nickel transport system permease protein
MFRYLVRRLLWAILLFIVITFVTFVIFYMAPNNPARGYCGGENAKPQCLELATEKLGLDKPVPVQYLNFLKRIVIDRSLGVSYFSGQDVNEAIAQAAPVTASLVFGGAVLWMMIGLVVGVFSALKPRSLLDRLAMVFVLIGVSAHPVWIGLIFSYFFGFKLGEGGNVHGNWGNITHLPIANYANFFGAPKDSGLAGGPGQWFLHLILPWCTFAILSINASDLAVVQGVVVFSTLCIIFFNLLVDLLYAWIDPRIRLT